METIINGMVHYISSYTQINLLLQYEYQRSGADMQYRFYYKLYLTSTTGFYQNTLRLKINLDGSDVFTNDHTNSNKGWSVEYTTGWITVSNKTSGSTSLVVSVKDIINSSWCNYTSGTCYLTVAPAYTSITSFTVSKRSGFNGLTGVSVSWSAEHTCSSIYYSKDNGSNWVTVNNDVNASSGSFNITGLTPETGYNFKLRVKRRDSGLTTDSGAYYQTTYAINKITSGTTTINNGSSLSVTANNPSGSTCRIRIECANQSRFSVNGKSATFSVSQINSLMQYYPNDNTFIVKIVACTLDGNGNEAYWHVVEANYNIINSNPIFNDYDYFDNNNSIVNVTGNNVYIVKNKSSLKISISSANKMVAQNYATPVSYRVEIATLSGVIAYSENDVSLELGSIDVYGALNLNVSAIDSRGNITTKTKVLYVIDYESPSQSVSIKRENEFENTTRINVGGVFSPITCGTTNKNSIQRVRYRYKESTSSTWNSWRTMTVTNANNNYTCTQQVISLNNEKSFNFEVEVTDKIETITLPYFLAQGIPIQFISSTNKNVGIGTINNNEEYSLAVKGNIYFNSGHIVLDYDVISQW